MKSKAQKRREARERIERRLPTQEAALQLVRAAYDGCIPEETQIRHEIAVEVMRLQDKIAYMRIEIEAIKAAEKRGGT